MGREDVTMRRYTIYLLHNEVAMNYFGKEELLYDLFLEAENKISPYQSVLLKQINYITKEISIAHVHELLLKELDGNYLHVNEENHTFEIDLIEQNSRAVLVVNRKQLSLYATGTYEAETIFFEALRKIERGFLAVDFRNENYGWLSPLKSKNFV